LSRPFAAGSRDARGTTLAVLATGVALVLAAGCAEAEPPDAEAGSASDADAAAADQGEGQHDDAGQDEDEHEGDAGASPDADGDDGDGDEGAGDNPGADADPGESSADDTGATGSEENDDSAPSEPAAEPDADPRLELLPGVSEILIEQVVDGVTVQRRALIALPSGAIAGSEPGVTTALPVLVALHGNGGRPEGMLRDLRRFVDDGRFAALVPEGIARSWNLGREASTADDVAFIDLLLDQLGDADLAGNTDGADSTDGGFEFDLDRVYAFGYSNGAGLVNQLLARSDRYHAVAAAASGLTHDLLPTGPVHATSLLSLHGTEDPVVPYDGGVGVAGHDFLPIEDSVALWADRFDCPAELDTTRTAQGNVRLEWAPCDGGHRVVHYRVEGADHGLPPDLEGGLFDLVVDFFETADQLAP